MKKEDLIIKINGKITKMKVYKKVFVSGNGGAVSVPKELINKIVEVRYENAK